MRNKASTLVLFCFSSFTYVTLFCLDFLFELNQEKDARIAIYKYIFLPSMRIVGSIIGNRVFSSNLIQ